VAGTVPSSKNLVDGTAEVEKVVQPGNLVDRKDLSNHSLTEIIWGKSRYIFLIFA
jgi:hypothetical protein